MELKEEKLFGKAPNYCKGQRQILGYFSCLSLPKSSGTREWIRPGLEGSRPSMAPAAAASASSLPSPCNGKIQ